jgi:hypothetical protein
MIHGDRRFATQVLFDGYFSQGFLFHWVTSKVGLIRNLLIQILT